MSFWPEGISVENTSSPMEILEQAREEWETKSDGLLTLVLKKEVAADSFKINVHAKNTVSGLTSELFDVGLHEENGYPAFLGGPLVSPRDFERKLSSRFQEGFIKLTISNLLISEVKDQFNSEVKAYACEHGCGVAEAGLGWPGSIPIRRRQRKKIDRPFEYALMRAFIEMIS